MLSVDPADVAHKDIVDNMDDVRAYFSSNNSDLKFNRTLPPDIAVPGKYRFFVAGQGINFVDDRGHGFKLTLPLAGQCNPWSFMNQLAVEEYRIVKTLNDAGVPNVTKVTKAGALAPNGSLGMEYEGLALADALNLSEALKEKTGVERMQAILPALVQAADTIMQANEIGIVNRDIKPQNILINFVVDPRDRKARRRLK